MSRQQFLAELTQYMTFVTPAERDVIIAAFEERFDRAGPEDESALIMELGTPMSIAIAFKRRREAGELIIPGATPEAPAPEADSAPETPETPPPEETASPEPAAGIPEDGEAPNAPPEPELPVEDSSFDLTPEIPHAAPETAPPVPGLDVDPGSLSPSDILYDQMSQEEIPAIGSQGTAPRIEPEPPSPRKKLSAGSIIGASLLSVVIAAVFAAIGALGAYLLIIMGTFLAGALQTLSTAPEALWMFTVGLGAGAAGLLLLWLSLWAAVSLIRKLFCGPAGKRSVFRVRMKKIWRVVWIIFGILLVAAALCGYFFSRETVDLENPSHPKVASLIDWLYGNPVSQFILGLFGL